MAGESRKMSRGASPWIVWCAAGGLAWLGPAQTAKAQPSAGTAQQSEELPAPVVARDLPAKPAIYTRSRPTVSQEERRAALAAAIEEVRKSGILEKAINVGDKAVDFQLPESTGSNLRLSELWAMGPVVLVFYRGGWCPYCSRYLHEMQGTLEDIVALDAQLVAIGPELPEYALATQGKNKFAFPLLSDKDNAVARQYGLVYRVPAQAIRFYDESFDLRRHNGDDSYELPLTATYVIDRGGVVRYAFLEPDYAERAAPKLILEVLRNLKRTTARQATASR